MQVDQFGDVYVLRLEGPTLVSGEPFGLDLAAVDDGVNKIVLDCRDVRMMSAAVIGKLAWAWRVRREKGPQYRVVNLNEPMERLLKYVFHRVGPMMIHFCQTEKEAIESFQDVKRISCPTCGGSGSTCTTCGKQGTILQ